MRTNIPIKPFPAAGKNDFSTIILVHMQLCANSDCCDIKQSLGTNSACFFSVSLQNCDFLHDSLLQVTLFAAMLEKRAAVNANMGHAEILDTCLQQEVMIESGPVRV